MALRLNVEKPISYDKFSPKLGTVNKNNPEAVYLMGKTYVTPEEYEYELNTYKDNIRELENRIRGIVNEYASNSEVFKKNFILNFEVSEAGLRFGKRSYLFFQIFFSQKNLSPVPVGKLKEMCEESLQNLLGKLEDAFKECGFKIDEK